MECEHQVTVSIGLVRSTAW